MFGGLICGVLQELRAEQEMDAAFEKAIGILPADDAQRLRDQRNAEKEADQRRADEERRHRELCNAIRSTSFWRF